MRPCPLTLLHPQQVGDVVAVDIQAIGERRLGRRQREACFGNSRKLTGRTVARSSDLPVSPK
jgi:hypothetical protein